MANFKQALRMGLKGVKLAVTKGPKTAWRLTREKTQRMPGLPPDGGAAHDL